MVYLPCGVTNNEPGVRTKLPIRIRNRCLRPGPRGEAFLQRCARCPVETGHFNRGNLSRGFVGVGLMIMFPTLVGG